MLVYAYSGVYQGHFTNYNLLLSCHQALSNLKKAMLLPLPAVLEDLLHPILFHCNLTHIQYSSEHLALLVR